MKKQLLLLVMMLLPIVASADAVEIDGIYYNLNSTWNIAEVTSNPESYKGSIKIPNKISYEGKDYIVRTISKFAFSSCEELTSITLGDSIVSIKDYAFSGCKNLTSISIGQCMESIDKYALSDCTSLTSVEFHCKKIDNWFNNNIFIKKIVIGKEVKTIGTGAFCGCEGLTSIAVPDGVTSIGYSAFEECTSLTSISLPNSVTTIDNRVFSGCTSLTSITLPNNITTIGSLLFDRCTSLTSIVIPNSVISFGENSFSYCTKLATIDIPKSVVSIEKSAFASCNSLTSVFIPNSVTSINPLAFSDCRSLTSLNVDKDNPKYDSRDNCNAIIETQSNTLVCGCSSTIIPNTVTIIGENAFNSCYKLTSIVIPNSVVSIGDAAFWSTSLSSVTYGDNIKKIGDNAFQFCINLSTIILPDNLETIGAWAFSSSSINSVTIGKSIREINNRAFYNCKNLQNVKVLAVTPPSAYDNSFSTYNTLYVPANSVTIYQSTSPWSNFLTIKTLTGEDIEKPKCTTPTISVENGEIVFACETEGVEYISSIKSKDAQDYKTSNIKLNPIYTVSVYATKDGYLNSETATKDIELSVGKKGDVNGDGKVSITDAVNVVNIILNDDAEAGE